MMAFDGLIEPHLVVEVGSEVPGIIRSVEKDRGDMVEAGQVVARLESGVEQANLELAKARAEMESDVKAKKAALEFARRNSERVKELFDVKALAFQKWDEVETQRVMAENELAQAMDQKRLYELEYRHASEVVRRKTILSPVSGVVMERYLCKGEYVEDKPIFKIAQIDPLNVEVVLPVSQMGLVKKGMKGTVKPEAPANGEYEATVTIVDKVIDAASGTFGVRLEMPNPKHKITPGLKCKVFFHQP
ncbi:efflux RND transporter periplasmic adaptor subunit [Thermodesulfobacteriota bacterium]